MSIALCGFIYYEFICFPLNTVRYLLRILSASILLAYLATCLAYLSRACYRGVCILIAHLVSRGIFGGLARYLTRLSIFRTTSNRQYSILRDLVHSQY